MKITSRSRIAEESVIENTPALYPNPAVNTAFISLVINKNTQVSVSVVDMEGRTVIKSFQRNLNAGKQVIDVNTSHLSKGTYFVQVSHDGTTSKIKMMILR